MKKKFYAAAMSILLTACSTVDSGSYSASDGAGTYYKSNSISAGTKMVVMFVTLGLVGQIMAESFEP